MNDDDQLVRFDLADTARKANHRSLARMILAASTREEWSDICADFANHAPAGNEGPFYTARNAASHMVYGDASMAVSVLAIARAEHDDDWRAGVRVMMSIARKG